MVADSENLSVLTIIVAFQRIHMLLITNTRPAPFLASFGKYFSIVNFKAVYLEFFFHYQMDIKDIAFNKHLYNSLGWFGYDSLHIISNSAGSLLVVFIAVLVFMLLFTIL